MEGERYFYHFPSNSEQAINPEAIQAGSERNNRSDQHLYIYRSNRSSEKIRFFDEKLTDKNNLKGFELDLIILK